MLVAHGSAVVVRTFALVLERESLTVLGASDGDEALQSVAEHDPAVVFLDPDLPGFDPELARSLGGAGATVVVLGSDVLTTPFQPSRIVALARSALPSES